MCGGVFNPRSGLQRVCSAPCAIDLQRQTKEVMEKRRTRQRKAALKPKRKFISEAQEAFNRYVRERDRDQPCISCGRFHTGQYHAGHFRPRSRASQLRFHLWNCHKQCKPCNTDLSGNLTHYRAALAAKIGEDKVIWLEGNQLRADYSVDYLKRLKKVFNKKANRQQRRKGNENVQR